MEKTAEEVFNESAKIHMIQFGIEGFKRTHPHLFKTIMEAMDIHAKLYAKNAIHEVVKKHYDNTSNPFANGGKFVSFGITYLNYIKENL